MRIFSSTRVRGFVGLVAVALTAHAAAAGPLGPSDFTGDIHGPRLQALTLSPGAADVSGADAPMSADLRVTDDLSGVTHVNLTWTHPAQQLSQSVYASLHSGDSLDGQWQAQWSVPRYAPAGRYVLAISFTDRVGNIVHLYGDELAASGFPTGFDIRDANPDTTPPRVTSTGNIKLNQPVQSLVPTPAGYWMVASDGGVFAFGDAPFRGSLGGVRLNQPVTGMVPYGNGYLMVGEDGGIFNFSNLDFAGSLGANPPARPVVAVAALG